MAVLRLFYFYGLFICPETIVTQNLWRRAKIITIYKSNYEIEHIKKMPKIQ